MPTINYADGRANVTTDGMDDALQVIGREYPDAAFCENWETYGQDGQERQLVWESQDAMDADLNSSHSVCQIIR
jgi:hypothetical protein